MLKWANYDLGTLFGPLNFLIRLFERRIYINSKSILSVSIVISIKSSMTLTLKKHVFNISHDTVFFPPTRWLTKTLVPLPLLHYPRFPPPAQFRTHYGP